jgi:hypothetical protein
LTLEFLQSTLKLRVGASKIFDLEFHRTILGIKVINEVFESSIPLSHLFDIQFRHGSLSATQLHDQH